jgi:hypothetical protein
MVPRGSCASTIALIAVVLLGRVGIADRPCKPLDQLRAEMLALESATLMRSLSITASGDPSVIILI